MKLYNNHIFIWGYPTNFKTVGVPIVFINLELILRFNLYS